VALLGGAFGWHSAFSAAMTVGSSSTALAAEVASTDVIMNSEFFILNTRKRAVIALVHSIAFLALAVRDLAVEARLGGVLGKLHVPIGSLVLVGIYFIVSSILIYLLSRSVCLAEKLYFAFCAASATSGLVRAVVGDAAFPIGLYLRVGMLLAAVVTGLMLWRMHSESTPTEVREVANQLSLENE